MTATYDDYERTADDSNTAAAEMLTQLQDLFKSREISLQKREDELEQRLKLFQQSYPKAGKDSDVLHINVGGSCRIAVLRRTITHFKNSMLAVRFSGRWDDSIEKDKNGNFFIDQDPKVFLPLVNFLRQCDQRKRHDIKVPPPLASTEFCSMLEYYDLMSSVYPQEWRRILGTEDSVVMERGSGNNNHDVLTIATGKSLKAFMLEVKRHCATRPTNATSFTVTFHAGSTGQVGWGMGLYNGKKLGQDEYNTSFAFDVESSQFMASKSSLGNGQEWHRTMPVKIKCTYNPNNNTTYTIQVLENQETNAPVITATFENGNSMAPIIHFSGKVTISDVLYAF